MKGSESDNGLPNLSAKQGRGESPVRFRLPPLPLTNIYIILKGKLMGLIRRRTSDYGGIFGVLILLAIFISICFWTDRSLDFWLTYLKGTETNCPFWLSALVTIISNGLGLLFNVITEIARLAL